MGSVPHKKPFEERLIIGYINFFYLSFALLLADSISIAFLFGIIPKTISVPESLFAIALKSLSLSTSILLDKDNLEEIFLKITIELFLS